MVLIQQFRAGEVPDYNLFLDELNWIKGTAHLPLDPTSGDWQHISYLLTDEIMGGYTSIKDIPEELMVEEAGLARAKWIFQRIPDEGLEGISEDVLKFMRAGNDRAERSDQT